jgi:hypothetical protein
MAETPQFFESKTAQTHKFLELFFILKTTTKSVEVTHVFREMKKQASSKKCKQNSKAAWAHALHMSYVSAAS